MLSEAMTALAAAGGTAVVQTAGTDGWTGLRQALGRWFGRGDGGREQAELERLDCAAAELETAVEHVRIRQEAAWQARIETVLESLDDSRREQAVQELRALLARHAPAGEVSAGPGGLAVGGSMDIHADNSAIAAGVIHGGAHTSPPLVAGPSRD
ncbi:hypothetical protein ACFU99_14160 [Streptomyces sp. NPDC057654]|uniref:hypothetical protein n=1 Tax=Streptomyces sp. NPDC057654 TaxID=3346196 RepID=UPI0036995723